MKAHQSIKTTNPPPPKKSVYNSLVRCTWDMKDWKLGNTKSTCGTHSPLRHYPIHPLSPSPSHLPQSLCTERTALSLLQRNITEHKTSAPTLRQNRRQGHSYVTWHISLSTLVQGSHIWIGPFCRLWQFLERAGRLDWGLSAVRRWRAELQEKQE